MGYAVRRNCPKNKDLYLSLHNFIYYFTALTCILWQNDMKTTSLKHNKLSGTSQLSWSFTQTLKHCQHFSVNEAVTTSLPRQESAAADLPLPHGPKQSSRLVKPECDIRLKGEGRLPFPVHMHVCHPHTLQTQV